MNTQTFLTECKQRGISISVDGQDLIVKPDTIGDRTVKYIRQHKPEIVEALNDAVPHGACFMCGVDTECTLTRPDGSWDWQCIPCFDKGARPLPDTQKAVTGEMVRPSHG